MTTSLIPQSPSSAWAKPAAPLMTTEPASDILGQTLGVELLEKTDAAIRVRKAKHLR